MHKIEACRNIPASLFFAIEQGRCRTRRIGTLWRVSTSTQDLRFANVWPVDGLVRHPAR
jgi:hypothetical protein